MTNMAETLLRNKAVDAMEKAAQRVADLRFFEQVQMRLAAGEEILFRGFLFRGSRGSRTRAGRARGRARAARRPLRQAPSSLPRRDRAPQAPDPRPGRRG